jgi:hypothetical protein
MVNDRADNFVPFGNAIFRVQVIKYLNRSEKPLCKNTSNEQMTESSVFKRT